MNSLVHSREALVPGGDLSALIAKLEAAHATGIIMESEAIALQSALGLEDAYDTDWKQCCWNALKGSLDAALALAERLGWRVYSIDMSIIGRASVMLQSLDDRPGTDPETGAYMIGKDFSRGSARTPALALCAAILRAHASRAVEGE